MTDPSVGVSRLILATRYKAAATSARETMSVAPPRSVTDRITGGNFYILFIIITFLSVQV